MLDDTREKFTGDHLGEKALMCAYLLGFREGFVQGDHEDIEAAWEYHKQSLPEKWQNINWNHDWDTP